MNPRLGRVLVPVLFAISAIAGWQAAEKKGAAARADAPPPVEFKASKRGPRSAGRGTVPADVQERLAAIRAARTPEDRLRATLELAHNLPISEMERWYLGDWFDFHDGMDANLFFRITRARWLAEDPEGLMGHFLRRNHDKTHEMAARWARQDPRAAFAFLEGSKHPVDIQRLAYGMAGALAEADPHLAVSQVQKLQTMLGSSDNALSALIDGLAKNSPELLQGESAAWPAGLREIAATSLAKASLQRDFSAAVASLAGAADGKRHFLRAVSNSDLMKEMARHADKLPPGWFAEAAAANPYYLVNEDPAKWLAEDLAAMGFSEDQADRLRDQARNRLASKDPESAFQLLDDDDLQDHQRRNLLSQIFSSLSREDAGKAEARLARLTDPQEIAIARQAIDGAGQQGPKPAPEPAEWFAGLSDQNPSTLWQHARSAQAWNADEVAAAIREFRDLPAHEKQAIAGKLTAEHHGMPPSLRAEAIAHVLRNPPPVDPATAANPHSTRPLVHSTSSLAADWGREDPLAAGRWVASLPAGDERLWAAKNLAAQWAEYEPAAARRWAAGLPADERQAVVDHLDNGANGEP